MLFSLLSMQLDIRTLFFICFIKQVAKIVKNCQLWKLEIVLLCINDGVLVFIRKYNLSMGAVASNGNEDSIDSFISPELGIKLLLWKLLKEIIILIGPRSSQTWHRYFAQSCQEIYYKMYFLNIVMSIEYKNSCLY